MIEVTSAEEPAALKWLAGHGQRVGRPAPLLTALIATRRSLYSRGLPRYFAIVVGICVIGGRYSLGRHPVARAGTRWRPARTGPDATGPR
ncbi:hypothetical protein [Amycolatopsis sp. cmx-8-4]|uniref:hypothetical protein n=1 Tax=Amycolatopsis sp. cmx-8-4 TaxID=2790947 RepID=UPI00397BBEEA